MIKTAHVLEFTLNPENPRIIDDDKYQKLVQSVKDFPEMLEKRPLIVDSNMMVLGGNMRLKACKEAEIEQIPYIMADDWSQGQINEFIIKDNFNYGEWDTEELLKKWDIDSINNWGLDLEGLEENELLAEEYNYEIPKDIETSIKDGDIIEIGNHRLLCGDNSNTNYMNKLMNGVFADMVFTDPPYADILLTQTIYSILKEYIHDGHIFIMNDDKATVSYLINSKFEFENFFIADFLFASPRGNNHYLRHILVTHEKVGEFKKHKNMKDSFSSIIKMNYRHNIKDDDIVHNHQKDIVFISKFINHYSNKLDVVLDLFLGSGSTMIASHQLERICYGAEIEPIYCQVIIDRMIKLDNNIEVKINGKHYSHASQD